MGNEDFKNSYFKNHEKELLDLVENGQHPKALFIGCADSRVVPELITGAAPGDLFIVRNVGNFVAPYDPSTQLHASAPGIEYAVAALKVSDIIVCGHTHCGAINSLFKEIDKPLFDSYKKLAGTGETGTIVLIESFGKRCRQRDTLQVDRKTLCGFTDRKPSHLPGC